MDFKVLTLRYSPALGAIDDAPLVELASDHEVLGLREHLFVVNDIPHLLCVVSCQPRHDIGAAAHLQTRPVATAASTDAVETTVVTHDPGPTPGDDTPVATETRPGTNGLTAEQRQLYDTIRHWRYETAQRDGVPPYVVLTNLNLAALVREQPASLTALGQVRGIGKAKLARHGEALLALLRGETPTLGPAPVPDIATPTVGPAPAPDTETQGEGNPTVGEPHDHPTDTAADA
ncbi:MAG: HRDC domain-containing protein [Deltaproteobacteria bacterium]|nr:HRDC domain-containing protein [Deltaproteobacteria bacterium]